MSKARRLGLMGALLAVLSLTGAACILTVEPETAVNPVGTEHTVTATVSIDCEIISCQAGEVSPQAEGENVTFEVIQGPNMGEHSDGDCGPNSNQLCIIPGPGQSVSWTYVGNGGPGIDYIQVCFDDEVLDALVAAVAEQTELSEDEIRSMLSAQAEGEGPEINEPEPEEGCDIVSKVWEAPTPTPTAVPTEVPEGHVLRERPPNIGAGLSGLFQGQPTPLPTAAAVAPAASRSIQPPNTGDAGLR